MASRCDSRMCGIYSSYHRVSAGWTSAAYAISEAHAGIIITAPVATVAITAVPLTLATAKMNRRTLLIVLIGIFIGGNLIAAAASTFSLLLGVRIVIVLTHALFW